jgi:hypothetical protein
MRHVKAHTHKRSGKFNVMIQSKVKRHYSDVITSSGVAEKSGAMTLTTNAYVFFGRYNPPVGHGFLINEVSRSHTTTHHCR